MLDQDVDLDQFFREEKESVSRFLDQLTAEFQRALARRFAQVTLKDCDFYHTTVLGDDQVIIAEWNWRGDESAYTGGSSFDNKRAGAVGKAF